MKKLLLLLALIMSPTHSFAGPGHDHGESAFANSSGPAKNFELNDYEIENLDIQTSKVEFLAIREATEMLAFTELLPEKTQSISPHFEGKIKHIAVQIGEYVSEGQDLVTFIPVNAIGNTNRPLTLKAKKDGMVLGIYAFEGSVIQSGEDVMRIGDSTQMLVRGVAYETPDINSIQVGQKVEVHLDTDPDRHIHGTIQRINRVIDPESRTFSIYAIINTPNADILPGLQGTMEIFKGNDLPVMAIPKRAVLGELEKKFVYVSKGNAFEKRDVLIGHKTGHHVEIKSGLFPHEQVVVNGNYQLQFISISSSDDHENHEDHSDHEGHDDHSDHDH